MKSVTSPIIALVFMILILNSLKTYSQRIQAAFAAGFNTTNVQGDDVYGFRKFGPNAGLAAIVPFSEKIQGSLEIGYSAKGAYHKPNSRGMDYRKLHDYDGYKIILDYVEIPLMIHYQDKNRMNFGAGISYGRLVKVEEYEDRDINSEKLERVDSTTLDGPYDPSDISAVFAFRLPVYHSLRFDMRYIFSLTSIRERYFVNADITRRQFNQVLTFRLFYVINEKASEKRRIENTLGK